MVVYKARDYPRSHLLLRTSNGRNSHGNHHKSRPPSKLPCINLNHQATLNYTVASVPIDNLPHQSGSVHANALGEIGGVYVDVDLYTLRDFASLGRIGFEDILSEHIDEQLHPPVIYVTPGYCVEHAYFALQSWRLPPSYLDAPCD
jgi:hypothetical protein